MLIPSDEKNVIAPISVLCENTSKVNTEIVNNVTIINIYVTEIDEKLIENIRKKLSPDQINVV